MKNFARNLIKIIATFALALVVGLPWQTANPTPVYTAKADSANNMDTSFVIDDLGVDFVSQYKPQAGVKPALQSFMEYMYTDKEETRGNYALYVYIYNPSQTEYSNVVGDSVLNMAVEYNDAGEPVSYANLDLKNCGYTMGQYDKLFYKFRVLGLEKVLANAVTSEENLGFRRYDLATIQLRPKGAKSAEDYDIGKIFTYQGYGKGCGAGAEEESTLVYKNADMDVLRLKVHPTTYRPAGSNGKSAYTQDSLHSVWFSVPNKYIEKYGEMYAVQATWLDAVLKPALVTGNKDAYTAISQYLGKDIGEHCEDLLYAYLGGLSWESNSLGVATPKLSYNAKSDMKFQAIELWEMGCSSDEIVSCLYMLFDAGSGENSADEFLVTSEMLKQEAIDSVLKYGGPLVLNRYSQLIFSSIAKEKSVVRFCAEDDITSDDDLSYGDDANFGALTSQKIEKSYWEKLHRKEGTVVETETFNGIYALCDVAAEDILGTTKEVSERLYILENDVPDLRADFATAQLNNETIYIFRYQVSDYNAYEAVLFEQIEGELIDFDEWLEVDTNARFFTETVNLDFEIIDITFKKDERLTVIPVVMSPIDVFPASTPALNTESDKGNKAWWEKINWTLVLVVVALVLLFPLYKPFLKDILDGLWWLITSPFRFLRWLFKKIFNKKE